MSVHSWPAQGAGKRDSAKLHEDVNETKVKRSAVGSSALSHFLRQPDRGNTLDGERLERANASYISRAIVGLLRCKF